jgi:alkaline phosphatase
LVAVALHRCAAGFLKGVPTNTTIATLRAAAVDKPGLYRFSVNATQNDGQQVSAEGDFEVVVLSSTGLAEPKVTDIVILLGDGMGPAQRTAARIVRGGYSQGKVITPLAMALFPVTGLVKTSSLNSVVTDSAPGMTGYVSGNKDNYEGVFPDDTADGYSETTDIDFRLLVGYGANADRYEDWRSNARPLQDGQQPFVRREPLSTYPATPLDRDRDGKFLVTGQAPGESAAHTVTDVPLSAFGPGAWNFTGVQDNTDVFFKLAQAAVKGVVWPVGARAGGKR